MADEFTVEQFREHFPEFSDQLAYPDAEINFWAAFADSLLNINRWGSLRPMGMELLIAHNISIQRRDKDSSSVNEVPGQAALIATSQSAGSVSIGFDVSSGTLVDGGNYNLTTYGTRFLQLARLVGTGGFVVI